MTAGGRLRRALPALPAQPPYLVAAGTGRRALSVGVMADASTSVVEVAVHGRWSRELGDEATATLQLCLAGPASTVIVDLLDLGDLHGVSRTFWLAAVRRARLRPDPVQMVLCLPAQTMLDYRLRHGDADGPQVFATVPDARRAIATQPWRGHRVQARLDPEPVSVRAARDLVVRACRNWQLSHLRNNACLVVSELTANAVEHAGTGLVVTVSASGSQLHLAVRDGDGRYPRLPAHGDRAVLSDRGRGLLLVHAMAAAWGVLPARSGKVVWATLSPAGPGRA
ncbi:ATP-binding protein [Actinoplanes missouriensis]|uniref:ATP-binding protein n=1 Tax=Actinoplanes missouriensis TaxID=1866 RepID=UPI0033E5E9DE